VFDPSEQAFRLLDCLLFQAGASSHEPASNYPAFPFAAPPAPEFAHLTRHYHEGDNTHLSIHYLYDILCLIRLGLSELEIAL
jgi:hypothetical protein